MNRWTTLLTVALLSTPAFAQRAPQQGAPERGPERGPRVARQDARPEARPDAGREDLDALRAEVRRLRLRVALLQRRAERESVSDGPRAGEAPRPRMPRFGRRLQELRRRADVNGDGQLDLSERDRAREFVRRRAGGLRGSGAQGGPGSGLRQRIQGPRGESNS